MKSYTAAAVACLLASAVAAPVDPACVITSTTSCSVVTATVLATDVASIAATASASVETNAVDGTNVQKFTGNLGGAPPPVIKSTGERPFSVKGDTFVGSGAALGRSCDVQHNACASAANSGQLAGGVGQCDTQNNACHAANGLRRRWARAALDLGSCSNPTILFENGLDGRNTAAFIAADQKDFNHGSALNIAVIAGFICQRLGDSCKAPADSVATCSSASAAAVATTQNQAAADAFNKIIGGGAAEAVATATATASASAAAETGSADDEEACDAEEATATETAAPAATGSADEACDAEDPTATDADLATTTVGVVTVTYTSCA